MVYDEQAGFDGERTTGRVQAIQRALEISPDQPEWLLQRIECVGKAGELEVATVARAATREPCF